ncbi:inositol monophosphatase family protein [Glaciihabitans sp. GrIS 2.15]|uniref:inositol monophosphatase family protein n=1 Tax=Glaciihabitans sp. GrIS 2.15 TaxID=3071710 RepID=UPI002E095730|nr:histidinol-phosphatase [Glaciihabitans sp. GrIS 2.15]
MTEYSRASDLQLARELADMADAISMDRFRSVDLVVTVKPDMTPVSDADRAVETALRAAIADSRAGDSVRGEEFGVEQGAAGDSHRQWIIDPIDGTKNYVRGVPIWATLISLAIDGVPVVGVVSAPALGTRWWGATGQGAFVDERLGTAQSGSDTVSRARRIHVSRVAELADASISLSGLTRWENAGKLPQFLALTREVWRTRDYGDMWPYMMVAEGLLEVSGEYDLQVYDMAALVPIVQEAGGTFTSVDGEDGPWHGSALATNGLLHDRVIAALAESL